jgi:hypothetical protein
MEITTMAKTLMNRCEEKRLYKVEEKKLWRWVEVADTDISGDGSNAIRCMHCHGAITLHKSKAAIATQDQVEHRARVDSDHCKGGHEFQESQTFSSKPVE